MISEIIISRYDGWSYLTQIMIPEVIIIQIMLSEDINQIMISEVIIMHCEIWSYFKSN